MHLYQKIAAASSAFAHRNELKALLRRKYEEKQKVLTISVAGQRISFDTSDFLSNFLLIRQTGEPATYELLAKLIRKSHIYADIGGNIGLYTIIPAVLNPNCKIFYFEVDAVIRTILEKNIALNGLDTKQIAIVNAAVGDSDEGIEYTPHPYSFALNLGGFAAKDLDIKLKASTVRLDDYFAGHKLAPDLLKIDVDGEEMSVLRGMTKILETKPTLLLELHPTILPSFGSSCSEVFSFLKERDYDFYLIENFRKSSAVRLERIYNFDQIVSPVGEMVLVTRDSP
jgi:FkbM family methyltransferase